MDSLRVHDPRELLNYDKLWAFLKGQPALRDKQLPHRSETAAWDAACKDFRHLSKMVVLSASLVLSNLRDGPLFSFQLQPLKLDMSHRLGRRFGHDRFFEMKLPTLVGSKFAKQMPEMEGTGSRLVISWLVREAHEFLGRQWRPFYVKDGRVKRKNTSILEKMQSDPSLSHRMYFYAENGIDFIDENVIHPKDSSPEKRCKMSVSDLITWLIHPEENKMQPYLKLFSRISLGK